MVKFILLISSNREVEVKYFESFAHEFQLVQLGWWKLKGYYLTKVYKPQIKGKSEKPVRTESQTSFLVFMTYFNVLNNMGEGEYFFFDIPHLIRTPPDIIILSDIVALAKKC